MQLLLKNPQVNINDSNRFGYTPFHCACFSGHPNVIHLFLSSNRKIDFEKRTTRQCYYPLGFTGFDILKEKDMKFDKIQKDKISKNEKLIFSAADGDLETLKELLKIRKYFRRI